VSGSRPPHTALVLGDQLARDDPALIGAARVLLVESLGGRARLRTHRQRVHLVVSAMRRFAAELREQGHRPVRDFLDHDRERFAANRRMRNQLRGLRQLEARGELGVLRERAARARAELSRAAARRP